MRFLLLLQVEAVLAAWNGSYTSGSMKGLYTYSETVDQLAEIEASFPAYVPTKQVSNSSIGLSYLRESIPCLHLTSPIGPTAKVRVLVTAGHSATAPISTSFALYLIKRLLEQKDDPIVSFLLSVCRFSVIPVVNPDALKAQSVYFSSKSGEFGTFPTNLNKTACSRYFFLSSGVNLSRNYGYMWGIDDFGSSNQSCDPQYRGVFPFSEQETLAVATLVMQGDFEMAVNYEGEGNHYFRPLLYAKDREKAAYSASFERSFYEGIGKEPGFPVGAEVGSMDAILGKLTNGGLVDWLYSKEIPAYEVALGLETASKVLNEADLLRIYTAHWPAFLSIAQRASTHPRYSPHRIRFVVLAESNCATLRCANITSMSVLTLSVEILNSGFRNSTQVTTKVVVSVPEANYTFEVQEVVLSFAYLDREKPTQTAVPIVKSEKLGGNSLVISLISSLIPARSVARFQLNIERAKIANAVNFPPIVLLFQVLTLPGASIAAPEWRLPGTFVELNYTLRATVPVPVLPLPSNSTDSGQYTAIVIGLSVAGSFFLLATVLVAVFFLIRWLHNRSKSIQTPIPAFEEAPKALEAGTIDFELDQTPNQV